MAINTTSVLSDSVRARYLNQYIFGARPARVYDQFAAPVPGDMSQWQEGTSVQANYLSRLAPSTSTISEVNDVTPKTFRDATATITPTSRGDAIQDSELALMQTYTDYMGQRVARVGEWQMESVDLVAQAACLQGTNIIRTAARASLDAGTTTHRLTDTYIGLAQTQLTRLGAPDFWPEGGGWGNPNWMALMHPDVYHDLRLGGNVIAVGQYQRPGVVFNNEVGMIGPFAIMAEPRAKVFWAAGAANTSAIATTISADANAQAKSITVASATNIDVGDWILIGTIETADTHYATNEWVRVTSVVSTTIGIIGAGDNGGLVFDHTSGATVSNADPVYPVVYGGPESVAKLFATNYISDSGTEMSAGPFGTLVGPKVVGNLNQFVTLGWKWYGGYGRWSENWLLRGEYSSSIWA